MKLFRDIAHDLLTQIWRAQKAQRLGSAGENSATTRTPGELRSGNNEKKECPSCVVRYPVTDRAAVDLLLVDAPKRVLPETVTPRPGDAWGAREGPGVVRGDGSVRAISNV